MAIAAPSSRITLLAAAADAVAVVVFAAVGRLSHAEADDILGLVGTAAMYLVSGPLKRRLAWLAVGAAAVWLGLSGGTGTRASPDAGRWLAPASPWVGSSAQSRAPGAPSQSTPSSRRSLAT